MARLAERPVVLALGEVGPSVDAELAFELASALEDEGLDVEILVLGPSDGGDPADRERSSAPVTCLGRSDDPWPVRLSRGIEHVADRTCSYVALDAWSASVVPRLPREIRALAKIGRADRAWFEESRLLLALDGVVATDGDTLEWVHRAERDPGLRFSRIPVPVHVTPEPPDARDGTLVLIDATAGPLDLGLLDRWLGQTLDLDRIVAVLPEDREVVASLCLDRADGRPVRVEVAASPRAICRRITGASFYLLPVPVDDVPMALLEALGRGLVPLGIESPSLDALDLPGDLRVGWSSPEDLGPTRARLEALRSSPDQLGSAALLAWEHADRRWATPSSVVWQWRTLLASLWRFETPRRPATGPLHPPPGATPIPPPAPPDPEPSEAEPSGRSRGPTEAAPETKDSAGTERGTAAAAPGAPSAPKAAAALEPDPPTASGTSAAPSAEPAVEPTRTRADRRDPRDIRTDPRPPEPDAAVRTVVLALAEPGLNADTELARVLATELGKRGLEVRIAALNDGGSERSGDPGWGPRIEHLSRGPVPWPARLARMIRYVDRLAPCAYVALDSWAAAIAPRLGPATRVILKVHDGDLGWFERSRALSAADAVVAAAPRALESIRDGGDSIRAHVPVPIHGRASPPTLSEHETLRAIVAAPAGDPSHALVRYWIEELEGLGMQVEVVVEPAAFTTREARAGLLEGTCVLVLPLPVQEVPAILLDAMTAGVVPVGAFAPALDDVLEAETRAGFSEREPPTEAIQHLRDLVGNPDQLERTAVDLWRRSRERFPDPTRVAEAWYTLLRDVAGRPPVTRTGEIYPPIGASPLEARPERELLRVPGLGTFHEPWEVQAFRREQRPWARILDWARRAGRGG